MYLEQSPDEHLVPYQTPPHTQLQLLPVPSPLMSRDTKYTHAWIQEFLPGEGGGGVQVQLPENSSDVFLCFFSP